MSDEQLDEALLPLREILAARAEAANVIEGSAEPVALPVPRRSPTRLRQSPSKNTSEPPDEGGRHGGRPAGARRGQSAVPRPRAAATQHVLGAHGTAR